MTEHEILVIRTKAEAKRMLKAFEKAQPIEETVIDGPNIERIKEIYRRKKDE